MLTGINHITISVNDLDESFAFYTSMIGMKPKARWASGAYLSLGDLWFCLSVGQSDLRTDYSHIAFDIEEADFQHYSARLVQQGVKIWQENESEGHSLYILDPNGHKLEIHSGSLETRLASMRVKPYPGLEWF